jgi:short-subunit dehydrogenase
MAFAHKVAIITGASSGIGWALAKALAQEKCLVGVIARRQPQLEALTEEIRRDGGRAAWAVADVRERPQILAAIARLRHELGPVDLLIANAGVGQPTTVDPFNVSEVENMFRVNTLGVIYSFEGVLPEMLQRQQGHLAAISSLGAYKGLPGESAYCASKAAVNVFLDSLRVQLRPRGIAVTTICPGFVDTPMIANEPHPKPFQMSPAQAARYIVRALRQRRKVYNFPWQVRFLMRLAAWAPDWLLGWVFNKVKTPG